MQKSSRFNDHYRHLVDDFVDTKDLKDKADKVRENYIKVNNVHNSKLANNCSSDKANAIRVGIGIRYSLHN